MNWLVQPDSGLKVASCAKNVQSSVSVPSSVVKVKKEDAHPDDSDSSAVRSVLRQKVELRNEGKVSSVF